MRILFIGDIVGSSGREALTTYAPKLKKKYRPQTTIANGENTASGRGVTSEIYRKFLQGGVDVVAMGNHTWDNRGISEFTDDAKKMVRPANFPEDAPGQGMVFVKVDQLELAVTNLQARIFVVSLEDPFKKATELVVVVHRRTPFVFVDFHGETTNEKQAMGWLLDGQVSAVVGTHMHAQTNNARTLPKGITFLGDIGVIGPYGGILGMRCEPIIEKFMTASPKRFEVVETGRTTLSTCTLGVDDQTGQAEMTEPTQTSENCPLQEQQRKS